MLSKSFIEDILSEDRKTRKKIDRETDKVKAKKKKNYAKVKSLAKLAGKTGLKYIATRGGKRRRK